jgi:type II secretory pathway component PulM
MINRENKNSLVIKILVAIVVLLVLVLVYFFVVQPGFNKFVYNKQIEAANIVANNVYADMLTQLQNTGMYKLQVGNQTLILIPYQPSGAPTQ